MNKEKLSTKSATAGVPHHQVQAVSVCDRCYGVVPTGTCCKEKCKGAGLLTRRQCLKCQKVLRHDEGAATHACSANEKKQTHGN